MGRSILVISNFVWSWNSNTSQLVYYFEDTSAAQEKSACLIYHNSPFQLGNKT